MSVTGRTSASGAVGRRLSWRAERAAKGVFYAPADAPAIGKMRRRGRVRARILGVGRGAALGNLLWFVSGIQRQERRAGALVLLLFREAEAPEDLQCVVTPAHFEASHSSLISGLGRPRTSPTVLSTFVDV